MTEIIPAADLPFWIPGAFDSVVGVDEATGAARRFPLSEIAEAIGAVVNAPGLIPLVEVSGAAFTADGRHESSLLRCTNGAATTITVRADTSDEVLDWTVNASAAVYFSVRQVGAGQVTLVGDTGVTLTPPAGYLAKTRAQGGIITATRDGPSTQSWTLSGDLAIDPAYVPGGAATRFNKVLSAAFSSNSVTPAAVTGWTFNVAAGKSYKLRVLGTYQTAATTTGGVIGVLGAGGVVGNIAGYAAGAISALATNTGPIVALSTVSGAGSSLTTTGVSAINTPHWLELEAIFRCTTSGTLSITWASEVASSAAQLNVATALMVEEIAETA